MIAGLVRTDAGQVGALRPRRRRHAEPCALFRCKPPGRWPPFLIGHKSGRFRRSIGSRQCSAPRLPRRTVQRGFPPETRSQGRPWAPDGSANDAAGSARRGPGGSAGKGLRRSRCTNERPDGVVDDHRLDDGREGRHRGVDTAAPKALATSRRRAIRWGRRRRSQPDGMGESVGAPRSGPAGELQSRR